MRIRSLLEKHAREILCLNTSSTVDQAIDAMAENKTSAVIVLDQDHPVGIFAERDVIRCYNQDKTRPFSEVPITAAMTNKLITASPDDTVASSLSTMLMADIRHLPVVSEGKLTGLLSLSDLVKNLVDALSNELDHLHRYVDDLQEAGRD